MSKNSAKLKRSLQVPASLKAFLKFLQSISPRLAMRVAARIFTTPMRYKIPKREHSMEELSRHETLRIKSLNKRVVVYHYGHGKEKILLVHGWSGRGTQLVKFAEEFIKAGYGVISFDAPAHGKSNGSTSLLPEFIAVILELQRKHGRFKAAVGHSLGGMALLNACKRGLELRKLVVIGSGDIVKDIMDDFVQKLGLHEDISDMMKRHFEKKSPETMDSYSAFSAAQDINCPVLVIHDSDDAEVPVQCATNIYENLPLGEIMITSGLGHRKILGNAQVILSTVKFIHNENF